MVARDGIEPSTRGFSVFKIELKIYHKQCVMGRPLLPHRMTNQDDAGPCYANSTQANVGVRIALIAALAPALRGA